MESTAKGSLELNPSTQIVVSNDDLLTEILIQLPLVSLHVFKSVSKHWCTLITNPSFNFRRSQNQSLDPASGLFIRRRNVSEYDFVRLDTRIPVPLSTPFTLDSDKVEIVQSCNGLILCHDIKLDQFIVYNPSMKRFKTIPQSPYENPDRLQPGGWRIAFDPSKSTQIVRIGHVYNYQPFSKDVQIQIYSSKTCEWSVTFQREKYDSRYTRSFNHGIYWNDAIHWLDTHHRNWHNMLDIAERLIKTRPQTLVNYHKYNDKNLFESRGCLLLVCSQNFFQQLHIYEMSGWNTGWSLKYRVNLNELLMPFPNTFYSRVRSIMIGDKDEDSFLVMEMCGQIVRYNIGLKTYLKIYELDSAIDSSDSFQFIVSIAAV